MLGITEEASLLTSIHDTVRSDQWPGSGIPNVRCLRAGRKLLGAVRLRVALVMKDVWCWKLVRNGHHCSNDFIVNIDNGEHAPAIACNNAVSRYTGTPVSSYSLTHTA